MEADGRGIEQGCGTVSKRIKHALTVTESWSLWGVYSLSFNSSLSNGYLMLHSWTPLRFPGIQPPFSSALL